MIKIELIKFEAQDVITASDGEITSVPSIPLQPAEYRHDKWYCQDPDHQQNPWYPCDCKCHK